MGTVKEVKPLGVIAMIDDGELDWKVCFVLFYLFICNIDGMSSIFSFKTYLITSLCSVACEQVIAVATDDDLAKEYNDIDDVPDAVKDGIREWFRWYKTPDDKPLNGFGFDEKWLDAKAAGDVIEETHEAWKKLRSGDTEAGKLWTGSE